MYTIKQAAARTGVAIPTIRAWERRYGVVAPTRTAAGYRLYDEDAIERLAAMRFLVETEGWRPSQAAERVKDPTADLATLAAARPGVDGDEVGERSGRSAGPPELAVAAFVAAAQRVDVHDMERFLDEAFATQRFELAMDMVVFPALRGIGQAWAVGELDVAAEHAASETVRRRLARFFDAARGGATLPQVLVGMPPAGHHELGAFAFAVACRRAGLEVLYLGADVPLESWLRMVHETAVPAVVLGAVSTADSAAVATVIDAIRTIDPPPACFAGGPAAVPAALPAALDARVLPADARVLPAAMDDAVAVVRAAVERAERRSSLA